MRSVGFAKGVLSGETRCPIQRNTVKKKVRHEMRCDTSAVIILSLVPIVQITRAMHNQASLLSRDSLHQAVSMAEGAELRSLKERAAYHLFFLPNARNIGWEKERGIRSNTGYQATLLWSMLHRGQHAKCRTQILRPLSNLCSVLRHSIYDRLRIRVHICVLNVSISSKSM